MKQKMTADKGERALDRNKSRDTKKPTLLPRTRVCVRVCGVCVCVCVCVCFARVGGKCCRI